MPNDEVDRIIEATDIVALVSKYVKLEKQGKNYMGLCPFHNEDTPSFVVSPDKRIAHCFGCGGGGNPVNFLMQIENIEFPEAMEKLAEFNGMEYHGTKTQKKDNPYLKYYKIMQTASDFYKKYFESAEEGAEAREYLHKRGLDDETISNFNVGLAPKIGDTLYQVLKDSGYLELDIADMSLADKSVTGYHDIFSNRIMFPISDDQGHVVAFSGRVYLPKDKDQPKYINSRETRIFEKGKVLFNLNQARPVIMKKHRIILHEGQMDVIASTRAGLGEAVCTLGTALSDYHVKMLSKYAKSVVICYDGDGAGIKASKKAIKLFKENGFAIHLVLMEGAKDPDEFVLAKGKEAYKEFFESHMMDPNQYLFTVAVKDKNLGDSNVVSELKNEVFGIIQSMNSATERENYLNRLAEVLSVSLEAVKEDYDAYSGTHAVPRAQDIYPNPPVYPETEEIPYYPEGEYIYPSDEGTMAPVPVKKERWNSLCELRLFMHAKSSRDKALYIDSKINMYLNAFSIDSQRLWIKLVNEYYENFPVFEEGKFINMLSEEDCGYYIDTLEALRNSDAKYNDEDMNACIEKIKQKCLDVENTELKEKVKAAGDVPEASRLIDRMVENIRKKEQLKSRRK